MKQPLTTWKKTNFSIHLIGFYVKLFLLYRFERLGTELKFNHDWSLFLISSCYLCYFNFLRTCPPDRILTWELSSVCRIFPSFSHVTRGSGIPPTSQFKVAIPPSTTTCSSSPCDLTMNGGTATYKTYLHSVSDSKTILVYRDL